MYDLRGAQLTFQDVIGINKQHNTEEIVNFFILMRVYGAMPEIQAKQMLAEVYDHV